MRLRTRPLLHAEGRRHARKAENRVHLHVHRYGLVVLASARFGAVVVWSVAVIAACDYLAALLTRTAPSVAYILEAALAHREW